MLVSLLLALGLTVDCFVIGMISGAQSSLTTKNSLKIAFSFAIAQCAFLLIGWWLGSLFHKSMEEIDHWIAFSLLLIIGVKMIVDGIRQEKNKHFRIDSWSSVLALSVATSLDALVVGMGIRMGNEKLELTQTTLILFVVAVAVTLAGIYLGKREKLISPKYLSVIGGLVLVGMGAKMLFTA